MKYVGSVRSSPNGNSKVVLMSHLFYPNPHRPRFAGDEASNQERELTSPSASILGYLTAKASSSTSPAGARSRLSAGGSPGRAAGAWAKGGCPHPSGIRGGRGAPPEPVASGCGTPRRGARPEAQYHASHDPRA